MTCRGTIALARLELLRTKRASNYDDAKNRLCITSEARFSFATVPDIEELLSSSPACPNLRVLSDHLNVPRTTPNQNLAVVCCATTGCIRFGMPAFHQRTELTTANASVRKREFLARATVFGLSSYLVGDSLLCCVRHSERRCS